MFLRLRRAWSSTPSSSPAPLRTIPPVLRGAAGCAAPDVAGDEPGRRIAGADARRAPVVGAGAREPPAAARLLLPSSARASRYHRRRSRTTSMRPGNSAGAEGRARARGGSSGSGKTASAPSATPVASGPDPFSATGSGSEAHGARGVPRPHLRPGRKAIGRLSSPIGWSREPARTEFVSSGGADWEPLPVTIDGRQRIP